MKKRALVIYRLTPVTRIFLWLVPSRWFKKCDVYYLDMHLIYRDIDIVNGLEKKGIRWVKKEYKEFSRYLKSMFDAVEYGKKLYEKTKDSHVNRLIAEATLKNNSQRKRMEIVWKYYLYRAILPFSEQYAAAQYLAGKGEYDIVTVVAFNSLASLLKDSLDKAINLFILPGIDFYKGITRTIRDYFPYFTIKTLRYFQQFRKHRNEPVSGETYVKSPHLKDVETYEVIYFPHQGVFYSDLFMKDHFYSEDVDSPIHKSKILHVSLGEKDEKYMAENYDFYKGNGIPYLDLYEISSSKLKPIEKAVRLFLGNIMGMASDIIRYGLWYILYNIWLFAAIERYRLIFSQFSNLKMALVGYDHLFPRYIAMALSLLDVKVCATQERLIFAFWPDNYYIFDYYFTAGRAVNEDGLKNSYIEHCIPVGMVREDKLYNYEKMNIYDEKYDRIKEKRKLVLALDYHMPDNEIEDSTRQAAKIHQTRQFYGDLMRLAREFPSLHIVIKGKIAALYRSPYISDIVEEIKGIDNMEVELDLKKYNPYYIGEKADFTIACHTSLADELLAAGRKLIFYETTDLMETLLSYDNLPIIVKDYEGLRRHVKNLLEGVYLDEKTIKTLLEKYYANCFHGNVQKTVQEMLEKIIKDGYLDENKVKTILNDPGIRKADEA